MNKPIWTPKNPENTCLAKFMNYVGKDGYSYDQLWRWSNDNMEEFWSHLWDFTNVIGKKGDVVINHGKHMKDTKFFPNASLNYAQNCLKKRNDTDAVVFWCEDRIKTRLSWNEIYDQVSKLQQYLIDKGVKKGDVVAGFVANVPQALIGMLAASSIGAIWSSASPDFGVQGVLDRFGQIKPKIMIVVNGYYYNGKIVDCMSKINEFMRDLPSVEECIVIPYVEDIVTPDSMILWDNIQNKYDEKDIDFAQLPFDHPLFIMFSSGTTGIPKCIVHSQGGVLLTHLKEHQLQCDIKTDDKVFYFTTCGWMMWNWQMSALASNATLLLYDGSPFYPNGNILFDYAQSEGMTLFGTAAKYIDALNKRKLIPCETHDLSTLRTMTSTGSPLVHEAFDYVYKNIKSDLHLASVSGGTDIVSCFVIGNPISPVYRGEIQGSGLGYAMDAFDDAGKPVGQGIKGEFVCTKPFPAMPVKFWNDDDGLRYHKAYFDRFDNIWCHGDFVEKTLNNGWIIHGRSDATLNPGGVRIGTAEIYRQVEQIEQVKEAIAIGQTWKGDIRIILFVVMQDNEILNDDIRHAIKKQCRVGASPRHVPAKIIAVPDIPRTKSGKITEIAVRDVVHGLAVPNIEALANPEALKYYRDIKELS